ncbi:MAG TPA: MaoC/PaaZ C-terminal domain-containing protein [Solirubrobacterales bacterium]
MQVQHTKTVREADVYLWAGLSGDLSPVHLDREFAASTPIGERIAHGVMMLALVACARRRWVAETGVSPAEEAYERIRFIAPVRIGDTLTVSYGEEGAEPGDPTIVNPVQIVNQDGKVVGAARHVVRVGTAEIR